MTSYTIFVGSGHVCRLTNINRLPDYRARLYSDFGDTTDKCLRMFVQFDEYYWENMPYIEVIAIQDNLDEHVIRMFDIFQLVSSYFSVNMYMCGLQGNCCTWYAPFIPDSLTYKLEQIR